MKKFTFLFVFALLSFQFTFAGAPTVPSSNLVFSTVDGAQFTGNFTRGNGNARIVIIKQGSPVIGVPENGIDYSYNSAFGNIGFNVSGEYVVAKTSFNSFSVSNLQPGTLYYVAIFEYNGSGANTEFLSLPLTGSQYTVVAPMTPTSGINATAIIGNSVTLNWTKGNGAGRIILAKKGSAVNAQPADLINYLSDPVFSNGARIGTDNYVVYKGAGSSVVVKGLEPNTTYHFASFEYNGSTTPVHLTPGAAFSTVTHTGPTVAPTASGFNFVEGNSYSAYVNVGNGSRRLFIARKEAPVTAVPVNGVVYSARPAFGDPASEIAPGEFVVSAGGATNVNVTNLEPNTVYHFRMYEYDMDVSNNTYYLTSSYAVTSGSTATTPTAISTNLALTSLTGNSASISFTPGNGRYRLVLMKAGSPVDAVPANLVRYPGNASFGLGTQLGTGNYSIQAGMNGAVFTTTNLQPGNTYHVSVYEFNGTNVPVYSAGGATFSFTMPLEPAAAATAASIQSADGKSMRLLWTNGSGSRRIVIGKKGSAVTARPVDKTNYTANATFGQGTELLPGEFVLYDGAANYFDVAGLEAAATYHYAVFEYNVGADGKPDYLTSAWLNANGSTVTWPTTQTVITGVGGLQSGQATMNFTKGNGASRIFIVKMGAPVNAEPQDFTKYTYNASYGTTSALISDNNYVVLITSATGSFPIYNLQPNTTYYVSGFEFNGSNEPLYLRPSQGSYSFTTPEAPGAVVPTVAASNAQVTGTDGNKLTLKWTSGDGEKRIVVMRKGSAPTFTPVSGANYIANAAFGTTADLGGGQHIVYNSNGSTADITNLQHSSTYYFTVYEYSGSGNLIRFLTSSSLTGTAATASAPTTSVSAVSALPGAGQVTLSWTNGNGTGRLVVMKEGSAVTALPASLGLYPASAVFKSGAQVAAGEYAVYAGTGNTVVVSGLENKTYHFRIFEYNGSTAPVYNTATSAQGSFTVSSSLPVKLLYFTAKASGGHALLKWATASEQNNASFTIERSTDGTRFDAIKQIAGAGNSNTVREYSYTDEAPGTQNVYYRLKQTDADGKSSYSPVVALHVDNASRSINIYPNPVKDHFRISLPAGEREGTLLVHDGSGRLAATQKIVDGQSVNAAGLAKGVYHVTVHTGTGRYNARIVKQ